MVKENYQAFTLVEMLIVMGIIVILMAIGIAGGRAAITNANKVAHESTVDQIYQAAEAYYTDNRQYPDPSIAACSSFLGLMSNGCMGSYIDTSIDGGSDATYYYMTDASHQKVMICTTLNGLVSVNISTQSMYCNGNAFSVIPTANVTTKSITLAYPNASAYTDVTNKYNTSPSIGITWSWKSATKVW